MQQLLGLLLRRLAQKVARSDPELLVFVPQERTMRDEIVQRLKTALAIEHRVAGLVQLDDVVLNATIRRIRAHQGRTMRIVQAHDERIHGFLLQQHRSLRLAQIAQKPRLGRQTHRKAHHLTPRGHQLDKSIQT